MGSTEGVCSLNLWARQGKDWGKFWTGLSQHNLAPPGTQTLGNVPGDSLGLSYWGPGARPCGWVGSVSVGTPLPSILGWQNDLGGRSVLGGEELPSI